MINSEGRTKLPKDIFSTFGVHEALTNSFMSDISFQLLSSNVLGTSFLSDNSTSLSVINALSNDSGISRRNFVAEKYLSTIIPFLEDVPLDKVMEVRDREEESIINFRTALNQAIIEYSKDNQFNELQAKQLYSEVIHPSLIHMEKRFTQAKVDLVKNAGSKILGTGVALVFGVYSGIIPANLVDVANALGLVNIISEIVQQVSMAHNLNNVIKNENYYFLLKLKQKVKE